MRQPHGYLFGQAIWGLGVMLYAPNDRDGFLFGHDGANEPAINSSARLDPASGNGIVVLSTGSAGLASSLGADWVLWQTGRLDFLAAADAAIKTLPLLLAGGLIILFLAGVLAWRQRRRT
jgi:hypothetical protein